MEWKRIGNGVESRLIVKQVRTVPISTKGKIPNPFVMIDPDIKWETETYIENYNLATTSALLNFISLKKLRLSIPGATWSDIEDKTVQIKGMISDNWGEGHRLLGGSS